MQDKTTMKTGLLAALGIAGLCHPSQGWGQSWDDQRPLLNYFGIPGIVDTPTAHALQDADVSISTNVMDEMARVALSFQIGPRFSGTFRYTALEGFNGHDIYLDRAFDIRYLLSEEGPRRPAVTIGLLDFAGTGIYSSEYIVATKTFGRLRASAGIGWGRLAEAGGFDNPLGLISSDFDDRPTQQVGGEVAFEGTGVPDTGHWFRGDAALFGGVQYLATDKLVLSAEYSPDEYTLEEAQLSFENASQFNVAASYRFDNGIDLGLAFLHGSTAAFQLNYVINAKNPSTLPSGHGDTPPALTARPQYSAADLGWTLSEADLSAGADGDLEAALNAQGLDLVGFAAQGQTARLRYRNTTHTNEARAIGRAARVLARNAPDDIETFVLEPVTDHGLTGTRVTVARADLEELEYAADGAWKSFARADLDNGYADSVPLEVTPQLEWALSPYIWSSIYDPRYSDRYNDIGIEANAKYRFGSGWVIGGSTQYRLLGDTETNVAESTASSNVPKVRTGARQYLEATKFALQDLYVSKYLQPTDTLYGRLSAGYFEHMYGGLSGEVLWAPQTSRFAFGAELNWVQQREFERHFGFQDYDVLTGHASAYLKGNSGMHYQVDAGRYLAGDWGATLKVEREFANGIRLGAFATFTDMDTEDFGEGSFDKGITFDVPLSALTGKRGKQRIAGTFRPILGDGGARVIVPGRLYDEIRPTRQGTLQSQWGQVFR